MPNSQERLLTRSTLHKGHECYWCKQDIVDAREEAGSKECAWATVEGDFGCDRHPISDGEGVGPHETKAEVMQIICDYHLMEKK